MVTTSVDMPVLAPYEHCGLALYQDSDNYISLSRAYSTGEYIGLTREVEGVTSLLWNTTNPYPGQTKVYLKFIVMGTQVFALYSGNGLDYNLTPVAWNYPYNNNKRRIGLYAFSDFSGIERNAKFDFVLFNKNRALEGFGNLPSYPLATGSQGDQHVVIGHEYWYVNDYLDSTYWEAIDWSQHNPPCGTGGWIAISISKPQTVNTICIKWGTNYSRNYNVYTTSDQNISNLSSWTLLTRLTNQAGGNTVIPFSPRQVCGVIIYLDEMSSNADNKYSIKTISVYGEDF